MAEQAEDSHLTVDNSETDPHTSKSPRSLQSPGVQSSTSVRSAVQILETAEDIQARREQVLNRYEVFKDATKRRRKMLEDARQFQCFRRDADEMKNWILEKIKVASDESYKDTTNLQTKIQKHQAFEAEVLAHRNAVDELDINGKKMVSEGHYATDVITDRLREIEELWNLLMEKLRFKTDRLQDALELVVFLRNCDELLFWISDKETYLKSNDSITGEPTGPSQGDVDHMEVVQKKFEDFKKELMNNEYRLVTINERAQQLCDRNHPDNNQIRSKSDEVNAAWHRLRHQASVREQNLLGAHEVHQFNRDVSETLSWMREKVALLDGDDLGQDIASVQTLQRKHDGLERDLAAIRETVAQLEQQADRLKGTSPEMVDAIEDKRDQLDNGWKDLESKANDRRQRLEQQYRLMRFTADHRELSAWLNEIRNQMSAEDLATDVAGAEGLKKRHMELKAEMDAREDQFNQLSEDGNRLTELGHPQANQINNMLGQLNDDKKTVQEMWADKK